MRSASHSRVDFLPLATGLVWTAGSIVAGTLAAPWVFEALLRLGRAVPALSGLRELEFVSVFSRCVFAAFLIAGCLLARRRGIRSWKQLPFLRGVRLRADFFRGLFAGLVSLGALGLLGLLLGAYQPAALSVSVAGKLAGLIVGALLVGLIEEALFRGLLYTAFRRICGVGVAALASSAIFAVVHFARPDPPLGTVHVQWHSGFGLLRHAFNTDQLLHHFFPFMLVLFAMGLLLCLLYEPRGNIFLVAGLHAGWVMAMQMVSRLLERDPEVFPELFGPGGVIAKSWIAFALIIAWVLWVALRRRKRGGDS